jgi:hypothetical protein
VIGEIVDAVISVTVEIEEARSDEMRSELAGGALPVREGLHCLG